jgi:hypothetical protein
MTSGEPMKLPRASILASMSLIVRNAVTRVVSPPSRRRGRERAPIWVESLKMSEGF